MAYNVKWRNVFSIWRNAPVFLHKPCQFLLRSVSQSVIFTFRQILTARSSFRHLQVAIFDTGALHWCPFKRSNISKEHFCAPYLWVRTSWRLYRCPRWRRSTRTSRWWVARTWRRTLGCPSARAPRCTSRWSVWWGNATASGANAPHRSGGLGRPEENQT